MSSQNDKPFNDDEDVFDAELADQPSTLSSTGIKDISDDAIEDISDYDDSEEGIFAATPPEKKKKSSSAFLLGTVAVIALIAAGGFYVSQTPELLDKVKSIVPMASLEEAIAPVADIAGQGAVAVGDAELAAIPQPQPIANVNDVVATAPVDTPAPSVDSSVATPEASAPVAAAPIDVPADVAPAPVEPSVSETVTATDTAAVPETPAPSTSPVVADIPAPPTPAETQAAVAESSAPAPADVPASPVETSAAPVESAPAESAAEPSQTGLSKVIVAETALASGKSSTNVVTKPDRDEKTAYFDSPGGEILKSIPAPAMTAKRGANESIIVVSKPNSKTVITASTTQEARVAAAGRALKLGRYDAALDLYTQLYKDNPRDGRILMGRAVALQKLGNIPDAVEAYEAVLDINSDNPEAIVNLMGLIRKEYPAVALEKLLGLQERHPNNPAIIAQLGIAYADAGNLEQATRTLNKAATLEPNNAQHYFNLAVVAERMKDRPRAIELYEKALETDAVYGSGRAIDRNMIYDRLTRIRS